MITMKETFSLMERLVYLGICNDFYSMRLQTGYIIFQGTYDSDKVIEVRQIIDSQESVWSKTTTEVDSVTGFVSICFLGTVKRGAEQRDCEIKIILT